LSPRAARKSKRWLLPTVCFVVGVAWILWLASGSETVPEEVSQRAPPTLRDDNGGAPPAKDPASSPTGGRTAEIASSGSHTTVPSPPIDPSLQLVFLTPPSASVGQAFDVRVSLDARQPTARIVVDIDYDPALLKPRSREELDYAQRAQGEPAFEIDAPTDGHVAVVMKLTRDDVVRPNVPVVQFEVLAPGVTQIRITSVSASDTADRPLPCTARGLQSEVALYE
jgi:hypothetical protein